MDADGARHLRDPTDAGFNVARRDHHQVVELVDHDHDVGNAFVTATAERIGILGRRQLTGIEATVVPGDVTHPDFGQEVVAHLHLAHRPLERVRGLFRAGDHLGEQMGKAVVLAEFHPFGVHEDQANLVRRAAHQDRRDQAVDTAGLAGTGLTGDQQVGHLREVDHLRVTRDIPTESYLEGVGRLRGFG